MGADGEPLAARSVALGKVYGRRDTAVSALRSVTLEFPVAEFAAVMGPSGSGKSTLLHCLAALDIPSSGAVFLGDTDISSLTHRERAELRRDRIGFVFQAFNLVPTLTARENITLPQLLAGRNPDRRWLATVVEQVGLRDRLSHRPSELSGGQQQRVAVARALAGRPEIIFADEPTGNLDTRAGHEVLSLLRSAVDDHGQTIVMVTHDPMAASYADRVVFLGDGSVVDELRDPTADRVLERLKSLSGEPPSQSGPGSGRRSGRRPAPTPVTIPQRRTAPGGGGGPLRAAGRWFSARALTGRGEREGGRVNGFFDDPELPVERTSRVPTPGREPRPTADVRPLPPPERTPQAERGPAPSRAQAEARLLAQVRDLWDEPDERVLALVRAAVDQLPVRDEDEPRTRPRRGEEPDEVIEPPGALAEDGWLEPLQPITPEERAPRGLPYRSARRDETVQWTPVAPPPPAERPRRSEQPREWPAQEEAPPRRSTATRRPDEPTPRPAPADHEWPAGNEPPPSRSTAPRPRPREDEPPPRRSTAPRPRPQEDEPVPRRSTAARGRPAEPERHAEDEPLPRRSTAARGRPVEEEPVPRRGPAEDEQGAAVAHRADAERARYGQAAPAPRDELPARLVRRTPPSAREQASERFVQRRRPSETPPPARQKQPSAERDPAPRPPREVVARPERDPAASPPAPEVRARPERDPAPRPPREVVARPERDAAPRRLREVVARPERDAAASSSAGREVRAYPARDAAERLLAQVRARAGQDETPTARTPVPPAQPPPAPHSGAGGRRAEPDGAPAARPTPATRPAEPSRTPAARSAAGDRPADAARAPAPRPAAPNGRPASQPAAANGTPVSRDTRTNGSPESRSAAAPNGRPASRPAAANGSSASQPVAESNGRPAGRSAAAGEGAASRPAVANGRAAETNGMGGGRPVTAYGPSRGRAGEAPAPMDDRHIEVGDDGFLPPVRGGDAPPADAATGDNRGLAAEREAEPRSSRR